MNVRDVTSIVDDPDRLRALHASGLLDSDSEPSFDRLAALAARVVGVPVALVSLVDVDRQFFKSCLGLPEPFASARQTPLSHSFCQHVVNADEPLVVEDARDVELVRDNLAIRDLDVVAYAGFPLRSLAGHPLGSFCVIDSKPRAWTDEELDIVRDIAESVNSEIALREIAASERLARDDAESSRRRLEFLIEASAVLSASLDLDETLGTLGHLAVPLLADWCVIDMRDEGGHINRVALAHTRADLEEFAAQLLSYAPDPDAGEAMAKVLRTGQMELVDPVTDEWLERATRDEHHAELLRAMGVRSAAFVPLIARGRTLGVMTFVFSQPDRSYEREDIRLLEELARHASLAVSNAELYAERDRVAQTLQASLLPPGLPTIPGVELSARYHPSGRGNEVGGDFYDAFQNASGGWLLVIGDARGKGPAAAALTGLARHTIRAAAMQHREPSKILHVLNDVLLQEAERLSEPEAERFCTVGCLLLEPAGDGARLSVASGGHPPALVLRDGAVDAVTGSGTLIGLLPEIAVDDTLLELRAGDVVVVYTDGVTEARGPDGFYGFGRLRSLLASCAGLDAQTIATRIEESALAWQDGEARDDIALIVARLLPAAGGGEGPSAR